MKLPPYTTFPTIPGSKVSLRQVVASDIPDLIEISFYDGVQATNLEQATAMQDRINQDYADGNSIHWCITDNLTNRIVGTCGYYRGMDNGNGELGCILLPLYRGQGFMSAAMLLAIDFGINTIGLKRIGAITSKQNASSIKLLERLGFIKVSETEEDEIVEYRVLST